MSANFVSYCTVEDVRDLGVDSSEATDEQLEDAILAAERTIDRVTEDHFLPQAGITLSFAGQETRMLYLPRRVRALTSVTVRGLLVDASFYTIHRSLNAAGTWFADYPDVDAIERYGATWPLLQYQGSPAVVVVGDFSWAETPRQIRDACAVLAYRRFKARTSSGSGGSGQPGGVSGAQLTRYTTETATFEYATPQPSSARDRRTTTGYTDLDADLEIFNRTPVYVSGAR